MTSAASPRICPTFDNTTTGHAVDILLNNLDEITDRLRRSNATSKTTQKHSMHAFLVKVKSQFCEGWTPQQTCATLLVSCHLMAPLKNLSDILLERPAGETSGPHQAIKRVLGGQFGYPPAHGELPVG